MSFSSSAKGEVARIITTKKCCQMAEFLALTKMDGTVSINAQKSMSLSIMTENPAVARKIFKLSKSIFEINGKLLVYRKNKLKKNNVYYINIPPQPNLSEIFIVLGIVDKSGLWNLSFQEVFPKDLLVNMCCQRAYLRGAFLGGGYVNDPEGVYHMEIVTNSQLHAEEMAKLMSNYDLNAKVCQRKNLYVVYLKEGEQIVDFLNIVGAHQALLSFENTRIIKDMRNNVNRLVNCETANLNKTVNAAVAQDEAIRIVDKHIGLDALSDGLREIAHLRLEYPEHSLKELGELLEPKLSKSGVNHRLKKIMEIAEKFN